jgi:hypothetical protein
MLGIFGQLVDFGQNDDSKVSLAVGVDDVGLSDLLDDVGDDDSVVDSSVRWID